jgi:hypothetical protein
MPSVTDLSTSLDASTTEHLIGEMEKLREHLASASGWSRADRGA